MPFESTQKGIQRGGYDCPYGQTTAFGIFAEEFHGARGKLQSDRYRGLGNFDGAIEVGGFLEVAIGLTRGEIELACQLANSVWARQLTLQQTTRGVQMPSLFRFGGARHLP